LSFWLFEQQQKQNNVQNELLKTLGYFHTLPFVSAFMQLLAYMIPHQCNLED